MSEALGVIACLIGVAIAFWAEYTLNKRRVEPPVIMSIEWELRNLDMRKYAVQKNMFMKELYDCVERRIKIELKRIPYKGKEMEFMVRDSLSFRSPNAADVEMAFLFLGVDFKSVRGRRFWQLTKDNYACKVMNGIKEIKV